MLTKCVVCHNKYDKRYSGKESSYVPSACSTVCFKGLLNTAGVFDGAEELWQFGVDVKPYTESLRSMRSNYERQFAQWLTDNKIEYKYEPWILTFPDGTQYVPDFYLPFSKVFIEIKGLWEPRAWQKFIRLTKVHISTYLINYIFLHKIIKESRG